MDDQAPQTVLSLISSPVFAVVSQVKVLAAMLQGLKPRLSLLLVESDG